MKKNRVRTWLAAVRSCAAAAGVATWLAALAFEAWVAGVGVLEGRYA